MKEKLKYQGRILNDLVKFVSGNKLESLDLESILKGIPNDRPIWILGAGKASVFMSREVENHFGDQVKDGLIITDSATEKLNYTQVFEGSHPYPDENSVSASYELVEFAKNIPAEDQVIFCLSGGASSLFCIPASSIETAELRQTYKLLLNSGASIHEINVVRKHLSETAGGRLGHMLSEHSLLSIIMSDVPGDDTSTIGSGPTVPDPSTFKDCFSIVKKYKIWQELPHSVRIHISKGMHNEIKETPKSADLIWNDHSVEVLPVAKIIAELAGKRLKKEGFNISVASEAYNMEIHELSKMICSQAISVLSKRADIEMPAALIYFGESKVNVEANGKGGRNQHLALMAALSIEGQHPISLMSFGTDGIDGPTKSAGAIINSMTTLKARKKKLQPEKYLQEYNSFDFHKQMNTHIITGRTGKNAMDLQVLLINTPRY